MMMFILLLYNRIYLFYEIMAVKYATNLVYIYIGVITINALINIILLGVFETDTFNSLIHSNAMEIGNNKIILQIDQGKENTNLVQQEEVVLESKNKVASVDGNKDESKEVKNLNPLKDIHKRL